MKLVNIFFICLFVLSASLQYNDPDPYLWMPVYLFGALICYLAIRKKFSRLMYIGGLIFYSAFAMYLIFSQDGLLTWIRQHEAESIVQGMKAEKPWIEKTREFFGLLILIVALAGNMIWFKLKGSNSK
jgi:hypothetical protein